MKCRHCYTAQLHATVNPYPRLQNEVVYSLIKSTCDITLKKWLVFAGRWTDQRHNCTFVCMSIIKKFNAITFYILRSCITCMWMYWQKYPQWFYSDDVVRWKAAWYNIKGTDPLLPSQKVCTNFCYRLKLKSVKRLGHCKEITFLAVIWILKKIHVVIINDDFGIHSHLCLTKI